MKIINAPHKEIEINFFRHGDRIYFDLDHEQYSFSLKELLELEDMDLRNTTVHE